MSVKIAIADEHPLIRRGIRAMIEGLDRSCASSGSHFSLLEDVGSTSSLLTLLAGETPDILLLGYMLNTVQHLHPHCDLDGLALIKKLHQKYPVLKVVLIAPFKSPQLIRLTLEAGAKAYVSHALSEKVLRDTLNCVIKDEVYIEPSLMKGFLQSEESLSAREIDVLRFLCKGGNLTDVSRQMHLSIKTVSAHKIRAMEKLQVKNDSQLYCLLARSRILDIMT